MATIKINKKYHNSPAEVRKELEGLIAELSSRYDLKCQWKSDDCLTFKRSGANGEINIIDGNIDFTMTLGLMLSALKGKIEQRVVQYMDEYVK